MARVSREELELRALIQRSKLTRHEREVQNILIKNSIPVYVQCIIGYYICDFVGIDRLFVLEVDGFSHELSGVYDERRDAFLFKYGFDVYRIANDEVSEHTIMEIVGKSAQAGHHIVREMILKAQTDTTGGNLDII